MFCTTSGLCTSGQKRGNYILGNIFTKIYSGEFFMKQGGNKWNPAINHQKFVEHFYFIQKLLFLEVQEVHG
jgi:hypothetical protein